MVSPYNKVLRRGGYEWKCQCDRRLYHSVCGVRHVCLPWRSVPIIKKLHLVLPTGTDMTTCPCTGTCSAVGPSDRSNTCSRNKPTQFLPSYNLSKAVLCFYYPQHRHTLLWQSNEIYPIKLWIKCPKLKQNLAEMNFEVHFLEMSPPWVWNFFYWWCKHESSLSFNYYFYR